MKESVTSYSLDTAAHVIACINKSATGISVSHVSAVLQLSFGRLAFWRVKIEASPGDSFLVHFTAYFSDARPVNDAFSLDVTYDRSNLFD